MSWRSRAKIRGTACGPHDFQSHTRTHDIIRRVAKAANCIGIRMGGGLAQGKPILLPEEGEGGVMMKSPRNDSK